MKVAVVGPVYPIRGGIAHSNTLLCENMAKSHDILALSFKRLYPEFLFPGKSQTYETKRKQNFKPEFCIDSINPITWLETFKKIRDFSPQVIILQWWTPFFAPFSFVLLLLVKLFTGARICIICANVTQHENKFGKYMDKFLTMLVFKRAHYFICLADGDLIKLHKWHPQAKARVLIEPTFDSIFNLGSVSKEKAKKRLGLKKKTILFFGFVREYKGLKFLLDAMPEILKKHDVDLVVAGEFWQDKQDYIDKIESLGITRNVKIFDDYIPDEKVGIYFSATDMVMLPYLDASQSGIVQIAIGALKPIVSTNVGAIDDFIDNKKTGYVIPPKNARAIAKVVTDFYSNKREAQFVKSIAEKKKIFAWGKNKEKILFFGLNEKS
ncbi:MAG: glycosyltransferase [Candidatus Woesearchaeota archaeon]